MLEVAEVVRKPAANRTAIAIFEIFMLFLLSMYLVNVMHLEFLTLLLQEAKSTGHS
jgi:hypothetical protein